MPSVTIREDVNILFDPAQSQQLYSWASDPFIELGVTYRVYPGFNFANYHGARLADLPVAVRRIRVFVAPTFFWQPDQRQAQNWTDPAGINAIADLQWRFPTMNQLGLMMFQPSGKLVAIPWKQPDPRAPIDLADQANGNGVFFAINHLNDPVVYAKHSGAATLFVAQIFP